MKTSVLSVIAVVATVYVALCAYLYLVQRSLIYFPTPAVDAAPADELWIANEGERIRVWRLQADRPRALLYFGGNAEDVALNIPDFPEFFPQHAIYLVNYRGYGGSTGKPREAALYSDAEAVFDFAESRHRSISVVGRSLGSGVATHLATARDVERLVLITPVDSFTSLAANLYPMFPVSLLLKDRYDSYSRAHRIDAPVLFVVAERDEIIPMENSERLAEAIHPSLVSWEVIADATHNSIGLSPQFGTSLRSFMAYEPEQSL